MFPSTDSPKNAVDMFPRTDTLKWHSFYPLKPCGDNRVAFQTGLKESYQCRTSYGWYGLNKCRK